MDAQTHDNVATALRGEAVAHARYLLFAAAARKRGETRLASMFDGIAAVELQEHFAELAQLVGLVGTDSDNVRAAIRAVHPWAVDAASQLESEPGVKDHAKVRAFVEEARA